MKSVNHKITKSEIEYGIFSVKVRDGTSDLFLNLPFRFDMIIRGTRLTNRKINIKKIWVGYDHMEKFKEGEIAKIKREGDSIYVD